MFKQHQKNLKALESTIELIQSDIRRYISMSDEKNEHQKENVYAYTKILSHLISSWIEVRVLKLAYEENAFSDVNIGEILSAKEFKDKWETALNIAICKAYSLKPNKDIASQLPFTTRKRYEELITIIEDELLISYQIRNRIAHGQWVIAFTNDLSKPSSELTGRLKQENIVTLQLKYKLFKSLAQTIHDLAVSPKTFERDFDKNYKIIEDQRLNIHKRDYEKYKANFRKKYQRGLAKRRENMAKSKAAESKS
jgi:hypothetical protein